MLPLPLLPSPSTHLFCTAQELLVLLADEVYQTNIYAAGKQFVSFKKVGQGVRGSSGGGAMRAPQGRQQAG